MAPEIISNSNYDGFKADIWSLGVILYECIFGNRPFEDNDITEHMRKITSGKLIFPTTINNDLKGELKVIFRFTLKNVAYKSQ